MFPRVKSSLIGALGSLVTVVLVYHVLKLSVTESYTRYLDTTEFTNYTLLQSLLLPVEPNLQKETPDIHLTLDALNQYASTTPSPPQQEAITILIRFKTMETLETQLNSISNQLDFSSSYKIHIICTTETEKLELAASNSFQHTLSVNPTRTWYNHIDTTDNTIIILDNQVIPGNRYFNFVLRLLNTPLFHHTLLGTESTSLICQPYAYFVPTLQDIFVLSRSQFEHVKSTPTDQISQSLFDSLRIPSILLPSDDPSFTGNTQSNNKCDLLPKQSLLFYKTSSNLDQMICEFSKSIQSITVISPDNNNNNNNNLNVLPCDIKVHQVLKQELNTLLNEIVPRVIIFENKQDMIHTTNATLIGFPTLDIPFVTPWISDLSLDTLQQWHKPHMNIVITTGGKRSKALKSIITQLKQSHYMGDTVDLSLVMDEKSDRSVTNYINKLSWSFGNKHMRHRIQRVHPMQTFTESWYPAHDQEFGILLDDRTQLSSTFYIWLKYNVLKIMQQEQKEKAEKIFGISLYAPRILDTDPSGRKVFESPKNSPYLMQVPTSFGGALYFPKHWREFHDYITARLTDQAIIKRGSGLPHLFKVSLLTSVKSNKWASSWRKYLDELIYMRGYVMLYPTESYSTLSTLLNLDESMKKKEKFETADKLYSVPLSTMVSELPDLDSLPVLDIHGNSTTTTFLLQQGHQLQQKFSACKPIIHHLFDPSDLLCPFNRLTQIQIHEPNPPPKTIQLFF